MDWAIAAPILLGSAISLVASLGMFTLAQAMESRKRKAELVKAQVADIFVCIHRLYRIFNFIEGAAREIDKEFKDLERTDRLKEPGLLVRPILRGSVNLGRFHANEIKFLARAEGELVAGVYEIEQRAWNLDALMSTYSELRNNFDQFMEEHSTSIEGAELRAELTGKDRQIAEAKIGKLNNMVSVLIETYEIDRRKAKAIISQVIKVAGDYYPNYFANGKLEIREINQC